MSLRPPRAYSSKLDKDPITAALDQEILAEKASTYGRLMRRLETALAELEACDRQEASPPRGEEGRRPDREANTRATLVARAGEALWHVVVQRELMRLPGTERFLREMKVPMELRLRMGVMRRR